MSETALTCGKCFEGWVCERHPNQPWPHDECEGPGVPCTNPVCPYRIDLRPVATRTGLVRPGAASRSPPSRTKAREQSSSNAPVRLPLVNGPRSHEGAFEEACGMVCVSWTAMCCLMPTSMRPHRLRGNG